MSNYYIAPTDYGLSKLSTAQAGGSFDIAKFVMGDANGQPYLPNSKLDLTALVHERARLDPFSVTAINPNLTRVIVRIPVTVGGFNVHEIGLLDSSGLLVYVGNFHGGYKPLLNEGASGTVTLEIDILTSGLGDVVIQINPNITYATQDWSNERFVLISTFNAHVAAEEEARIDGDATVHEYARLLAIDAQNNLNIEAYIRDARDENLQSQIDALGGAYPKIIACGFESMTTADISGWQGTKTIDAGVDLTNTSKYLLFFTLQGVGITSAADISSKWGCTRTSTGFTLTLKMNTDNSNFMPGTWDFTWSILQRTA